jgi:hypothetical protein
MYAKQTGELSFVRVGHVFGHNAPASIFRNVAKLSESERDTYVIFFHQSN